MPHGGAAGLPGDRGFRVIEGASAKKYLSPLGRCGRRSRTRTASRRLVLVLSRSSEHSFVGVRSSLGVTGISHGLSGLTTGSEFPRRGTRLGSKPTPISCPPGDRSRYAGLSEEEGLAAVKEWQQKKYDAGWACITWPKEQGGCGATFMEGMIWDQEEAKLDVPGGYLNIGHRTCAPAIMAHSMEE